MIILWSWNVCKNWVKNQGICEIPRKFQGLHVFPDRNLLCWGLYEIPKFQGVQEIPGYTLSCISCNI